MASSDRMVKSGLTHASYRIISHAREGDTFILTITRANKIEVWKISSALFTFAESVSAAAFGAGSAAGDILVLDVIEGDGFKIPVVRMARKNEVEEINNYSGPTEVLREGGISTRRNSA